MIPVRDPKTSLAILEALVGELDRFLDQSDLTRRVVVEFPSGREAATLTLGVVLELSSYLERESEQLSADERARLAIALTKIERARADRPTDYAAKLTREIKSHLDSWHWFVTDCARGDRSCADDYASEVWIRTRLAKLLAHAEGLGLDTSAERARLAELDETLKRQFSSGEYVGPSDDGDLYPRREFWWLYGGPARH